MAGKTSVIDGSITNGVTLSTSGYYNPLTVAGTGTIDVASGAAISYAGGTATNWTISNYGVIGGIAASQGIALGGAGTLSTVSSGSVVNHTGGSINGSNDGIYINGNGTVTNSGSINSANFGVSIVQTGTVSNSSSGVISETGGDTRSAAVYIGGYGQGGQPNVQIINAGTLTGYNGVVEYRGGSLTNAPTGQIIGQSYYGVRLEGPGTITNNGSIAALSFGIGLYESGALYNNTSGSIQSQVGVRSYGGTVVNAGTINGNIDAVDFTAYNGVYYPSLLRVEPGAVFYGNILGGQGTLELASASSTGTLVGSANSITNFSTLTFDAGARWNFSDDAAGLSHFNLINGLQGGNTIDMTDYAANHLTVSGGKLVLSGTGSSPVTLHVPGTMTSSAFYITPDGGGQGTDISGVETASWVGGSAGWSTASDWDTGTVPTAIDTAIIDNAGSNTVTIAPAESFAIANLTLAAGNILAVDGVLSPGGTVTVSAGHIDLAGTINGGTIADAGGAGLISNMGALDDVTYDGTLNIAAANEQLNILNGLTATGSSGTGPGTINLIANNGTLGFANVSPLTASDGQSLDNLTLNIGNATNADVIAPSFAAGTFTLGSGVTIDSSAAGALAGIDAAANTAVVFDGKLDAGASGGDFTIGGDATSVFNNNGSIIVSNHDSLTVTSTIDAGSGSGLISVASGAVADFSGPVASDQTFDFADATGILKLSNPGNFGADIGGFVAGDTIELVGIAADTAVWSSGTLTISNGVNPVAALSMPDDHSSYSFLADQTGGNTVITATATCFGPGTRILTTEGEIAIEDLRVGDRVLTVTGATQPVRWIGHRPVNFRHHPNRQRVLPVRIMAGAFGPNAPKRELLLSPDHAVYVENVLIPVRHLVNGTTVAQIECDSTTYHHVELPHHDVLLAEGLPAESYLEAGARSAFANSDCVVQLHPEFEATDSAMLWEAYGYAPLVVTGPELERAQATLHARAAMPRAA